MLERIEAEVADGIGDRPAVRVPAIQERVVRGADERAAADEGHAEAHAFFLREADDLDGERQAAGRRATSTSAIAEHHAEHAVERAASGTVSRCEPMNTAAPALATAG